MAVDFASDDVVFYDEFAEIASFQRIAGGLPTITKAIVEDTIENAPGGFSGNVPERIINITMPFSAVGLPVRGDTITIDADVYTVDGIVRKDALDVTVSVRES